MSLTDDMSSSATGPDTIRRLKLAETFFNHSVSCLVILDRDYNFVRVFVSNLESDSDDRALCEAIIVMAHKLGLKVIAEGIETTAQRDFLTAAGCDFAQGYLFSRPVPAAQFEALLH